jgi:hypothetical protein
LQAAAIRGEGETLPEMENPQGMTSCYTSGSQKAKGKSLLTQAKPQLKAKGRRNYLAFLSTIQGLS